MYSGLVGPRKIDHQRHVPRKPSFAGWCMSSTVDLLGLEEEDSAVTEVEVDEVFGLVSDKGAEVSSYDAVPGWTFSFVEL